ncbi:MAG: hypothetical protein PF440_05695, partial [Thiomicrorhabdus sp.]|nr:hypothetical protein [Thiomicrorhabdus sp.]
MNTKWKIILLVMLVITSICGVFITLYVFDSRENLKTFVEREIISIQAIVSTVEEENSRQYHNRIKSFITYANFPKREKVISAFARQDRGELLQLATPFFKILKAENPYFSTFSWATPDNRSFLRIHRPDKFGDEIGKMRPDVMDANIEHQQHSGYMVAKTGLQYRIVQPVFYEGKHVGVVQFGLKDSLLLDALHKNFNFPVGMAIPNTKFSFIKHSTLPSLAGSTHTIQSKQIDLFQGDNGKIDWNLKQQKVTLQGRPYIIANAFNLRGYKQELQGHIFVALDVSKYEEQLQSRIVFILFLSSGLLLLSFIILYTSYGSLIQKIITLNRSLEKNNLELESRVSERT